MSQVCDEIRPLWLDGIHKVTGKQERNISGVLNNKNYQIYTLLKDESCELTFFDWDQIPQAFACDSIRMSSAAFETIEAVHKTSKLPASTSWLFIQSYYSAFYAAHALLRFFGWSVSQLDTAIVESITDITKLYGMDGGKDLSNGVYCITTDSLNKTVRLVKSSNGSHAALWAMFLELIKKWITSILSQSTNASISSQTAATKLVDLQKALTDLGASSGGNWLSTTRNRITYQHSHAAWYPYQGRPIYFDELIKKTGAWKNNIDSISIWSQKGRELQRFVESCTFIVGLCREVCIDMANRCPTGKSFHLNTSINLMRTIGCKIT